MNRKKNLNPVFHLQDKKEDEEQLSKGMIKVARKSGSLNLSSRALTSGIRFERLFDQKFLMSQFIISVPPKVWHINELDKDEVEVNFGKEDKNEESEWWNYSTLTSLDLSSNVITSISTEIQCLQDLQVLNVSDIKWHHTFGDQIIQLVDF